MRSAMRWVLPLAVLAMAALMRFWALGRPDSLVFDELYYVRDAVSQLEHGFPTTWPDDEPAFGPERAASFTEDPSNAVHPPLGKWLIGLGILFLGPEAWGWRAAVALAGVATVGFTMRLAYLLSRNLLVACLAGLLLAIEGVHVVLTRVSLLDGFLTLAVVLGALFVWHDHERVMRSSRSLLWRPWLLAAGLAFGAATAIKWSGLYPLALFLLFVVARDLLRYRKVLHATAVVAATAVPAAASYTLSWLGWIITPGGWARDTGDHWWSSLWSYHLEMLNWHRTLTAEHPFQSHPLMWPFGLTPTAMYRESRPQGGGCQWADGCVSVVSPLPNLLITWGGLAALVVLACFAVRAVWRTARSGRLRESAAVGPATDPAPAVAPAVAVQSIAAPVPAVPSIAAASFVLVGYLSGWLPWVLTLSRSAVFHFYTVVMTPFAALALALVLGMLVAERAPGRLDPSPRAVQGRRIAVALFVAGVLAVSVYFFPIWSGAEVPTWFWRLHLWLPDWV